MVVIGRGAVLHFLALAHFPDAEKAFEKIAPANGKYYHNEIQNDDNGHSHICGSLIGSSVIIPFLDKSLLLGTWQQIFLVDFDTHSREREVVVSIVEIK